MKRENITDILNTVFGCGIYVTLVAGGLSFLGFLAAVIIGGQSAAALAIFIQKEYFPIVIKVTSLIIGIGLIAMYFGKIQALSLIADKKEADEELAAIRKEQH